MSEELENSLQQSIETYFSGRLREIDDQLAKLQTEFNEAFSRLREDTSNAQLDEPVSSAITAHLQAAREQKLSGSSSAPAAGADLSVLKRAIEEIRDQQSQSDVLGALLKNAAQFADRVALFVVKGEEAIGWRRCDVRDRENLESLAGVTFPLSGNTVVSHAVRLGSAETAAGTSTDDGVLIEQLGGDPQQLAAVPLVARKRVVAVLYADSAWPHRDAIHLDSLELLARIAGMAVEIVAPSRGAQAQPSAMQPAPSPPAAVISAPPPAPEPPAEVIASTPPPPVPEPVAEPPAPNVHVEEAAPVEAAAEEEPEHSEAVQVPEEAAPPPEFRPEPQPEPVEIPPSVSHYSAPLGSARRYGVAEPELPIEVGEDERRLHNDARRFARLLVSEIKLYNEQKVNEGRTQGNLYERLRDDIDRSRQMYDKRVAPPVAARHDYFHQELVNTLAEGDPAKLGNTYPGAAIGVS